MHDGVRRRVHELVAGAALQQAGVQVDPVAADVDDHAQLEEERPRRVERAQRGQEGHGGAPKMNKL